MDLIITQCRSGATYSITAHAAEERVLLDVMMPIQSHFNGACEAALNVTILLLDVQAACNGKPA
jgi:hypothetical protein